MKLRKEASGHRLDVAKFMSVRQHPKDVAMFLFCLVMGLGSQQHEVGGFNPHTRRLKKES